MRVSVYLLESGITITTSGCTIYETAHVEGYKKRAINYICFRIPPRLIYNTIAIVSDVFRRTVSNTHSWTIYCLNLGISETIFHCELTIWKTKWIAMVQTTY